MVPAVAAPVVRTFADLAAAADALAVEVVRIGARALGQRGRFTIALSGGSSPVPLFRSLAGAQRAALAWDRVDFLWADERGVPPGSADSNFGLADRYLLAPLSVPGARVHRIHGEARPIERAATEYEATVRSLAPTGSIDLALLGIGPDGHTASLFPGSALLASSDGRWVGVEPNPGQPPKVVRVTLTLDALNRCRTVAFLAAGPEKRDALTRALSHDADRLVVPAGLVRGTESTQWFVDRSARPP